jgi:hypothetical protein
MLSKQRRPMIESRCYFVFFFFLFTGPCPVFYLVCLISPDVDIQFSRHRFGDRPSGLWLFGSPLFAIFAGIFGLSSILSSCS